ncbi:hypothetical protein SAMN05216249_11255 [Acetitomaculum ruminis DSM 5522]|uniref:Glycosyltransferase 2-like domain-containing protein n=1 Tax=Acetitomaculum ruminis DSM 5522 TaxID=1120918 RepID=A0A1I0Z3J5_9FIRM|nr:glycosyltransferase [Acetitomaculum ruminis]SFB19180.1 hypothetical protein SAMN05216249_11255 [Acetitomaculum ruminis DSM 5522]
MKKIKVSVVVPVYNTEPYLKRCLDSLIGQTLSEVEIVAVNDGSTDGSGKILDDYKEKYPDRIQVIHKENGGQATARNLAFTLCKGEYIGFLDSDDYVKTDMFEKMYKKAKKTGSDYVACGYTDFTVENGKEVILVDYVASKPVKKTKDMFFGALASPFLHLYKRELITDNNIIFPEGVIYEDTAFYLNLIPYIKSVSVIKEALAFRLRHSNSTTTTFKKEKVANIFPVMEYSINFYKNNNFYKEYEKELEYFIVKVLLCSSMQRVCKVKNYKDSYELAKMTLDFIDKYFKNYRKSRYFKKGFTNIYMKSFCRATAWFYVVLLRISARFGRKYS